MCAESDTTGHPTRSRRIVGDKHAATYHGSETHQYECEMCGDRLTSYRAMMECEARDYDDAVAARKGRTTNSPKLKPTSLRWEDE